MANKKENRANDIEMETPVAELVATIPRADSPRARAAIAWSRWFAARSRGFPARIPRAVLEAIGGRSSVVRLSAATAEKQARRHPDLGHEDYAKVQIILDEGALFRKRDRELNGFVEADGRLWRAAIKTTRDGAETYLTTFHVAKPCDLASARRHMRKIERGRE